MKILHLTSRPRKDIQEMVRRIRYLLIASVMLILCACSNPQLNLAARDLTHPDINPHALTSLQQGGSITLALEKWIPNFNFNDADGGTLENNQLANALLPSSFYAHDDGSLYYKKDYFTDIHDYMDHGKQKIIYTINPRAHWTDGNPITWKDFATLANDCSGKDPHYFSTSTTGYDDIAVINRGVNDRQFILTMRNPIGEWQAMFMNVFPARAIDTPQKFNQAWTTHYPPTAGPFAIQSIDPITQTIVLKRNPSWWGTPAKLDHITFRVMSESNGVEPYISGEFTAQNLEGSVANATLALAQPNTSLRRGLSSRFYQLTFNKAARRITHDFHIRHAIALALNRTLIARIALGPLLGEQDAVVGNHFALRGMQGYQDNSTVHYDPVTARQELEADGWKIGRDGVRYKNGQSLTVTMLLKAGISLSVRGSAELIQHYLAQVGIRLILNSVPQTVWGSQYLIPGNFDIAYFPWNFDITPLISNRSIFELDPHCDSTDPVYDPNHCNPQQNYGFQGGREINRAYERLVAITSLPKRLKAMNSLDKLLWQDMGQLPMFQDLIVLAVRANLANYGVRDVSAYNWDTIGWMRKKR